MRVGYLTTCCDFENFPLHLFVFSSPSQRTAVPGPNTSLSLQYYAKATLYISVEKELRKFWAARTMRQARCVYQVYKGKKRNKMKDHTNITYKTETDVSGIPYFLGIINPWKSLEWVSEWVKPSKDLRIWFLNINGVIQSEWKFSELCAQEALF